MGHTAIVRTPSTAGRSIPHPEVSACYFIDEARRYYPSGPGEFTRSRHTMKQLQAANAHMEIEYGS